MTLERIAEQAGTSISTVSKAFSGSREISEYTRERIFAIAKEMGCFEKYCKRTSARPLIALLFPEVESEYYARVIGMLEREIAARGGDVGVELISQHMNYGLYRVEGKQDCPRDALNICRLLGMKPEILEMVEKNYEA